MKLTYIQKILFGSPGTGKSHKIDNIFIPRLGISLDGRNCIKTVFHPEYTYGDFVGKLLPLSIKDKDGKDIVTYRYYPGDFLKALSQAYRNILDAHNEVSSDEVKNVVLVIDEINRGNAAAIFGSVFQLLDRNSDGWSSYAISIPEMDYITLVDLVFDDQIETTIGKMPSHLTKKLNPIQQREKALQDLCDKTPIDFLLYQKIKIPPNLSIIGTMNTSDESIYYMDSAFKRRWDWEYISIGEKSNKEDSVELAFDDRGEWEKFVDHLNEFFRDNYRTIRQIEDKQIGYWFIKEPQITKAQVCSKLMFFVWDTVFGRNKKPLAEKLGVTDRELVTFGDFTARAEDFLRAIYPDYQDIESWEIDDDNPVWKTDDGNVEVGSEEDIPF